jgi:hypothetical protein
MPAHIQRPLRAAQKAATDASRNTLSEYGAPKKNDAGNTHSSSSAGPARSRPSSSDTSRWKK